jgi:hypothetical protein
VDLVDQRRLASARGAGDQDEGARAGGRGREGLEEALALALAAVERLRQAELGAAVAQTWRERGDGAAAALLEQVAEIGRAPLRRSGSGRRRP